MTKSFCILAAQDFVCGSGQYNIFLAISSSTKLASLIEALYWLLRYETKVHARSYAAAGGSLPPR